MAVRKRKNDRKKTKHRVSDVLGPPTDRLLIVELLKEMHHIVLDTGADLGASEADSRRALRGRRQQAAEAQFECNSTQLRPGGASCAVALR